MGTFTINVVANENEYYYSGVNSTTFTVIKHNSTVTVTVGSVYYVGDVFTINITNNTEVNVIINGKSYAVKADGTVDINTTTLEAGEYTVIAIVTENARYYGNMSNVTFKVVKYNATITSVNVTPSVLVGQNVTVNVTMGNVTSGTVIIEVNGLNYTVPIVNSVATLNVIAKSVGNNFPVNVYFAGDDKHNATSVSGNSFNVTDKSRTVITINVTSVVEVDGQLIVNITANTLKYLV